MIRGNISTILSVYFIPRPQAEWCSYCTGSSSTKILVRRFASVTTLKRYGAVKTAIDRNGERSERALDPHVMCWRVLSRFFSDVQRPWRKIRKNIRLCMTFHESCANTRLTHFRICHQLIHRRVYMTFTLISCYPPNPGNCLWNAIFSSAFSSSVW